MTLRKRNAVVLIQCFSRAALRRHRGAIPNIGVARERRITMKGGLRMTRICLIDEADRFDLKATTGVLKPLCVESATEIASTARALSWSIYRERMRKELERKNIVVSLFDSCTQACGDRFHNGRSRNKERIVCVQKKESDSVTKQRGDWKRQGFSLHGRLTHGRAHGRLLEGGLLLGRRAWRVVSKPFLSRFRGLRGESTSVGAFCGLAGSPLI